MGSVLKTLNDINMKFFAFLACVALVSAKNLKLDELEVGFCDGANQDVLSLDNISVEPFPLVIATGADITLNVQITLNEPVTSFAPPTSLKAKSAPFLSTLAHTVVLTLLQSLFQRSLESLWTFLPLELIMLMPL